MLITACRLKVSFFFLPVSRNKHISSWENVFQAYRQTRAARKKRQSVNTLVAVRFGGLWKRTERCRLDVSSIIHAPLRPSPPPSETESPFSFCISRLFGVSDKLPSLRVKLGAVTFMPSRRSERGNEPRRLWTPD